MYKYGMRLRGFSLGCQPMKGLVGVSDEDDRYYNVISYSRELSEDEVKNYDLDYIGKGYLCDGCGYTGECEYPQENHCEHFIRR